MPAQNCSVEQCANLATAAKGLCPKHYYRFKRHGNPGVTAKTPNGETTRHMEDFVLGSDTDECILWPYSNAVTIGGRKITGVARYVCKITHGEPPTSQHEAAHSCGNGHLLCVNRRHLSWKTPQENTADRLAHGTYQFGEKNGSAKLTLGEVNEIRALKGQRSQREIADIYGVTRRNIAHIHNGTSWNFTPKRSRLVRE